MELGLPAGHNLVLMSGSTFYKNEMTSLAVLDRLQRMCRAPPMLLRLGRATAEWSEAVRRAGLQDRIVELPHFAEDRMADLYNAVDCLLFPSWYEGFGLPPLKAMACGTPVVTSNAGGLPEAVGDAAPMFAPDDVEGLAEGARLLLEDSARRREQIAKGLCHVRQFSWDRSVRETFAYYEQIREASASLSGKRDPQETVRQMR